MASTQIAWTTGGGYITLTYKGEGNANMQITSSENTSFDAREQSVTAKTTKGSPIDSDTILVRQNGKTIPVGMKYEFGYTGGVQEVTLPKGRYKLQVWGAQGGNVTGAYAVSGSKGGYSEGVLELTEARTLYIFVGGQGTSYTSSASQTSTSVVNGGWNGGGAGLRTSRYNSEDTDGRSFPRGGGGATDIALVSSSMSYSSGRTTRSDESLKSRIIVAGGGAGASASYTRVEVMVEAGKEWVTVESGTKTSPATSSGSTYFTQAAISVTKGETYKVSVSPANATTHFVGVYMNDVAVDRTTPFVATANVIYINMTSVQPSQTFTYEVQREDPVYVTDVETSQGISNGSQQGGGTSGKGQYGGTQNSAGSGGAFGLVANQLSTNNRYCGGGGGGGWYGGGAGKSDNDDSYVDYSGGGSGFVNTAANASYRPSGYTGLQLESGTTTVGNTSHPSISGGTETGHSGNGYAIITKIS